MGAAMARSLAREGHEVTVWNRTPSRAEAVAGDGITACGAIADALLDAEVVFTMLFDTASVLDVTGEIAGALGAGAVWAQSTTVGPDGMRRIAEAAGAPGRRLLDAPVLGTKQPAEDGKLTVLVSGPSASVEQARPAFDAVGGRTLELGERLGDASALKLAANSWVASICAATAQAMGLAESLGLEPRLFLDAIKGGAADSAYAQAKGSVMAERGWDDPAFALDSVVKDVGLMVDAARETGFPDELLTARAGALRARLRAWARRSGHGGRTRGVRPLTPGGRYRAWDRGRQRSAATAEEPVGQGVARVDPHQDPPQQLRPPHLLVVAAGQVAKRERGGDRLDGDDGDHDFLRRLAHVASVATTLVRCGCMGPAWCGYDRAWSSTDPYACGSSGRASWSTRG